MVPEQFGPTSATWTPLDTCILRGWATWFMKEEKKKFLGNFESVGNICLQMEDMSDTTKFITCHTGNKHVHLMWGPPNCMGFKGDKGMERFGRGLKLPQSINWSQPFISYHHQIWMAWDGPILSHRRNSSRENCFEFPWSQSDSIFLSHIFVFNKRGFYFSMKRITSRILLFLENINKSFGCTI